MQNRKIVWERWLDPIGQIKRNAMQKRYQGFDDEFVRVKESFEEDEARDGWSGNVIFTENGFIPLDDRARVSKQFNMWICHTNFGVTHDLKVKIKSVPGVEVFQKSTPYRFLVGIGKAFSEKSVKSDIENAIVYMADDVAALKEKLSKSSRFWAIGISNRNEILYFGTNALRDYETMKNVLQGKSQDLITCQKP